MKEREPCAQPHAGDAWKSHVQIYSVIGAYPKRFDPCRVAWTCRYPGPYADAFMYRIVGWDYKAQQPHRWWVENVRNKNLQLHPAVAKVLRDGWLPDCKDGLVHVTLEYPRLSLDGRLAYIQSETKGEADRWTVTSPTKYIRARWTKLPDHYIRDVVAMTEVEMPFVTADHQMFVKAAIEGPQSCMSWGGVPRIELGGYDITQHPYGCYDPRFGWRMALIKEGETIRSRALVLHHSRGPYSEGEGLAGSVFVRTYRRVDSGGTCSCETLQAWLREQGVEKYSSWPDGARLARLEHPTDSDYDFMAPWIDGDQKNVTLRSGYLVIDELGDYHCDSQDGGYERPDLRQCSCCGEMADENEGIWIGPFGEDWVGGCCEGDYVSAVGRRAMEYYVHEDDATCVNGTWYVDEYMEENGVVTLANGDFEHQDNAFCCPINDQWYHDSVGVQTEDEGMVHQDDTWTCARSGLVFSTNTKPVMIDGETVHPDEVGDDEDAEPDPFALPYDKPEGSISNEAQQPLDLPTPAPKLEYRYYRRIMQPTVLRRTDGVTVEVSRRDGWVLSVYSIRELEDETLHIPVRTPDERIYQHPNAPGCLYRTGERGRADAWYAVGPVGPAWHHDAGDGNSALGYPSSQYECVSHPALVTEAA